MKRKFAEGARVKGKEGDDGKASFRGRMGTVISYRGGSGYWVKFDDGRDEYAYAHWLDPV